MSKKIKLSLDDLEIQSFVTSLSPPEGAAVNGGAMSLNPENTENYDCCWDLSVPASACYMCGSGRGCDDSLIDFCTFAANCGTGRWC